MKRPRFFVAIEILLLLLVIAGAFMIVKPAGRSLDRLLLASRDRLLESVYRQSGLVVRYGSMSPSLFRSVRIRDLSVADSGGAFSATFPDVEIAYGLSDLIGGKGVAALRKISLRGGNLMIDPAADATSWNRMKALFSSSGSSPAGLPQRLSVELSGLTVSYRSAEWSLSAVIDRGTAAFESDGLRLVLDSRAQYLDLRGKRGVLPGSARATVRLDARFDPSLSSGTSMVTLRNLEGDSFSVDSLRFLATVRDGVVRLDSSQDLQPVDFSVTFNPKASVFSGTFACDGLLPLRWFRLDTSSRFLGNLRDLQTTGTGSFVYRDGIFDWNVNLDALIPSGVWGGGSLNLDCGGKNDAITVNSISFDGPRGRFSGSVLVNVSDLSLDGMLTLNSVRVWRGTPISGDFYFQPESRGTRCIIPDLALGEARFTGTELKAVRNADSFDLSLSGFDSDGQFSVDGTLTTKNRWYLQLYGAFDTISVSNTVRCVFGIVSPTRGSPAVTGNLEPFKATTEAYFSTDFKNLSFNFTRMVLASTEKDGLFMLLSIKGTESSVSLTDISVASSGYAVTGNIGSEFGKDEILFSSDFQVNSLPYRFTGMLSGRNLSFYGDYGFALSLLFDKSGGITGGLSFAGLPLPLGNALFSLSLEAGIQVSSASDWRVTLDRSHIEELNGLAPLATVADFTGSLDSNGLFLDSCVLSDRASKLSGYLGINRLPVGSDSLRYEAEAVFTADSGDESIQINASLIPGDDLFMDVSGSFKNLPLSRFLRGQASGNQATGSFTLSGTPKNPFANLSLDSVSYRLSGFDLNGRARVSLDDRACALSDASLSWNGNTLSALSGTVNLTDLSSVFTADYQTVLGNSSLNARADMLFTTDSAAGTDLVERVKRMFDTCEVQANISNFAWKDIRKDAALTLVLSRQPGISEISAGPVSGFIADTGEFSLTSPESTPIAFYASGRLDPEDMLIRIDDVNIDAASVWRLTGLESVSVSGGRLTGNLEVSGLLNDPDFGGILNGTGVIVKAPGYLPQDLTPFDVTLVADKKEVTLEPVRLAAGKGLIDVTASFFFERWLPTSFSVKTSVPRENTVKVNAKTGMFSVAGNAGWDLSIDLNGGKLAVEGDAYYEKGSFAVGSADSGRGASTETNRFIDNFNLDLAIEIGKKVEFIWPLEEFPIISGLLQADAPLRLTVDTANKQFSLKGTTNIKGGEIFYVKRSFYLRQGRIEFNENESIFDPVITARAEIRERDSEGAPVRIILSAENQPLSRFSPVLSSDPAKPELELLALLGQAVTADASRESLIRDAVISSSDIFTQLSLFRQAENGIRDILGLDLFSIRTLILQNAIFGPAMRTNADTPMTIGNYFDNTTVYMGKYLGSAMYADALLHFSYYDPKSDQNTGTEQSLFENMLVQPEFGLEVTTPFFLLRWGITPGFTPENLRTLFVPDNSVTLSWKFSY